MPPRVSLCMIVKNEEANLSACLASSADLVNEIIVVDTGSTDATKELARKFDARVFDFPWIDDFAAARNESLRHATGAWIFWLDADDRLDDDNRRKLKALIAQLPDANIGYLMACKSPPSKPGDDWQSGDHIRLFRNDPRMRWQDRVHEQILPALRRAGGVMQRCDVVIHHVGYLDEALRHKKTARNLHLLELDLAEQPNNPSVLYHLGRSYLMLGRAAEGLPFLERCLSRLGDGYSSVESASDATSDLPNEAFVRKIFVDLAQGYRGLGQCEQALSVCRRGRERFPNDIELLAQEGFLLGITGDLAGAEATLRKVLRTPATTAAAQRLQEKSRHNLAVVYRNQGRNAEAAAIQTAPHPRPLSQGERGDGAAVALCMIVRNEEKNLADCLAGVSGLFGEIIVVDTGSADHTKEIAQRFGASVHDFPWCDDFAAARNEALGHATSPWIFWLDADDRIDADQRARLTALFAGLGDANIGYLMQCVCVAPEGRSVVEHCRLFRNDPAIRWRYRVHEQIVPAIVESGGSLQPVDIAIQHVGYADAGLHRRKQERNLRLLRLDHAERPDDALVLCNLGQTLLGFGQNAEALPFLKRSLERSAPKDLHLRKLHGQIARAHYQLGQADEALAACRRGLAIFPDFGELLFLESVLLSERGDLAGAEACLLRLLRPDAGMVSNDLGLCGYKARQNLALLYRRQKRDADAEAQWRAALAEQPQYPEALLGLAWLCVDQGRARDAEPLIDRLRNEPRWTAEVARLTAACTFSPRPPGEGSTNAKSKERWRVSLCMMVKNEEANLAGCLEGARDLVDEIIVVDTGSTDRTKEIAARFGARVVDLPWSDNFAAPRNEALKHATGDWIFWLDADDRIDAVNRDKLRAFFAKLEDTLDAYMMRCVSPHDPTTGMISMLDLARVFRNHPRIRWRYRVHEQILPAVESLGGAVRWADIVIQHTGYKDPDILKRKVERNLRLSLLDLRDYPDDPFVLHNIGKTYLGAGQATEAIPYLRRALELVRPDNSLVSGLYELLTKALAASACEDEALAVCRQGRQLFPTHGGLAFLEAHLLGKAGDDAGAEACWLQLLQMKAPRRLIGTEEAGTYGYLARHQLALLYRRLGRMADADTQWRAALAEQPSFLLGCLEWSELLIALKRWADLEPALRHLETDLQREEDAAVLRSRAHLARQEYEAARQILEATIRRYPDSLRPRQALSHVLLFEDKDRAAAERALLAVLAIDADHAEAKSNLAALRQRMAARDVSPRSATGPHLEASASRAAKVSLCMIVKNEEANLAECLAGVAGIVDEIVIVDTGSTDRTKETAARFGARIFDFPWSDDFAAARNESIRHAVGAWIFWLDADDRVDAENAAQLRKLFAELPTPADAAHLMRCVSAATDGNIGTPMVDHLRLFPNLPSIRWRYRVHEQIAPTINEARLPIRRTDIQIRHVGYQNAGLKRRKEERNLRLMRMDLAENPDDATVLYHLGFTYLSVHRAAEALPALQRSMELADPGHAMVRKLFALLVKAHRALGELDQAETWCRQGRERYPRDPELASLEAHLRVDRGDPRGAEACFRRLLTLTMDDYVVSGVEPGLCGYLARNNLAILCRDRGAWQEAEEEWKAALAEEPAFTEGWMGLADLLLGRGRSGDVDEMVRRLQTDPARIVEAGVVQSRRLMHERNYGEARAVLEPLIAKAPRAVDLHVALSHALLQEGRDPAAAERTLRTILDLAPRNRAAQGNLNELLRRQRRAASLPTGEKNRMRVSLCMIVKNEAANLPDCLRGMADLVDEIIVVDTGSRDDTKAVAAQLGARVFDFPWRDDFAAARNESIRHASGDWIFWLDADDRLDAANRAKLRELFASLRDENVAFIMHCASPQDAHGSLSVVDHPRLFRNRPDLRWRFRVHEQILQTILERGGRMCRTDIAIQHLGYHQASAQPAKMERNLRLLRLDAQEHPHDSTVLFHLGAAHLSMNQPGEALPAFRHGLHCAPTGAIIIRKLYALLAQTHRRLGQLPEALAVCDEGRRRFPEDAELLFGAGLAKLEARDWAGAEQCYLRLLQMGSSNGHAMGSDPHLTGFKARLNLGVIYREQGRLNEAAAQFRAVLAERPDCAEALAALAACDVALAKPASAPWQARVSLCMIVKNEEANLGDCLRSAADLVDEVIVVDTGSSDRTRELAARLGARVFEFPWIDDFAAARNESLRHASGQWIFWLDADDRIDDENRERLRKLFAELRDENAAYIMKCLCVSGAGGNATLLDHARLFRNDPRIRWRHRVHEQILQSVLEQGGATRFTDIVIRHVGYRDAAVLRQKSERYLKMLQAENAEHPDDPGALFHLGWTHQKLGNAAEAIPCLRRCLEQSRPSDSFVHKAYVLLARAHQQLGQTANAVAACREGRTHHPDDAELLFQEAIALEDVNDLRGAEARLAELLKRPVGTTGINAVDPELCGTRARHHLALIYQKQGRMREAEEQWLRAVEDQPEFTTGWVKLADLYAAMNRWPDLETLHRRLADNPRRAVEAALVQARGLMARRQFGAARRILQTAIAGAPQVLWPRMALSHVLLLEGRDWTAAEQTLLDVLALDPGNIEARKNLGILQSRRAV